jgi:hypothetical protein
MSDRTNQTLEASSNHNNGTDKGTEAPNHVKFMTDANGQVHPANNPNSKEKSAIASSAMVGAGIIPGLKLASQAADAIKEQVVHPQPAAPAQHSGGFSGFLNSFDSNAAQLFSSTAKVTEDLASGAYNEVKNHPAQVLEAAGKGLGITILGAAAVTGAAMIAPEAAVAVGVAEVAVAVGTGLYAGFQLGDHLPGWSQDAKVVSNAQRYSPKAVAAAHQDLKNVGADSALIAGGMTGALVAAPMATLAATDAIDFYGAASYTEPPTVLDVMKNAVTSGRYQPEIINGVTVLMPR